MQSNLQYLPAQIKVSYQLGSAPAEKATVHTCGALKAFILETEDGKRRNIQHFHNHYLRQNNISSHELGALRLKDMLGYMTIAEGERQTRTLAAVLTVLDPANLRWVGRTHPATDTIKDMLEVIHRTPSGAARAPAVVLLMDYLMKPETVEMVERYPTFKTCIIDKCNELRLLHFLEYPTVSQKCLEVLRTLGGNITPLSREQLEALAHKLDIPVLASALASAPASAPVIPAPVIPAPAPAPAPVPAPEAPGTIAATVIERTADQEVYENLMTVLPGNVRVTLGIGSYPTVDGLLSRHLIYSAKHKRLISINRFFNSYLRKYRIDLDKRTWGIVSVLKYFYTDEQAYNQGVSLYEDLLNWQPYKAKCLTIQTPEAFEYGEAKAKADNDAAAEAEQRAEDAWRARNMAQEEVVEEPCDCGHCSKELELEGEIQALQKRIRRLEEYVGLDE